MFQNLRVDIVYYNTNTDFELEFNLCGCCRMRLLTDKALQKKGFLHALSRAVSRSKVIMVVGKLFGDDGLIGMTSAAIGSKLSTVDNKSYGSASTEEIQIINGSVPLVTPEGFFGGCIVENGPQTLVLVSDNKNIRKSIMKTLIHPYLEQLCAAELTEKAAAATAVTPQAEVVAAGEVASVELIPEAPIPAVEPAPEQSAAPANEEATEITETAEAEPEAKEEFEVVEDITYPENIESITEIEEILNQEEEGYGITEELKKYAPEVKNDTEESEAISLEEPQSEPEPQAEVMADTEIQIEPEIQKEEEDILLEGGMLFETDDEILLPDDEEDGEESDFFVKPFLIKKNDAKKLNASYYSFEDEEDTDIEYGEFEDDGRVRSSSFNLPILILSVLILLTVAFLCFFIFVVSTKYGSNAKETLNEIYNLFFG